MGAKKSHKNSAQCTTSPNGTEKFSLFAFYSLDSINIEERFFLTFILSQNEIFVHFFFHINISNISKMTINVNRFQLHCFLASRQKHLCCVRLPRSNVPFTLFGINIQSRVQLHTCTKGITSFHV